MKLNWSHWLYTLIKTVIGGVAATGSAWLGTLVGNQVDTAIPVLQFNQLWSVLLSSSLLNLFFFLKQSPLPEDSEASSPPSASNLPVFIALAALVGVTGCRSLAPEGVYKGDKVVFEAETTITTSYQLVDTFLSWEKQNRAALTKWPEIKQSADAMRATYPGYHRSAIALVEAYKANPGGDAEQLQRFLLLLRTALNEAAQHMATAAAAN